jgi:hypothetical protein
MKRLRFVELAVLALFISIGFWVADAIAGFYDYCDLTAAGASCGPVWNCAAPVCAPLGVMCEVDVLKRGACVPFGFYCSSSSTCSGHCGGASPACSCPANSGCT